MAFLPLLLVLLVARSAASSWSSLLEECPGWPILGIGGMGGMGGIGGMGGQVPPASAAVTPRRAAARCRWCRASRARARRRGRASPAPRRPGRSGRTPRRPRPGCPDHDAQLSLGGDVLGDLAQRSVRLQGDAGRRPVGRLPRACRRIEERHQRRGRATTRVTAGPVPPRPGARRDGGRRASRRRPGRPWRPPSAAPRCSRWQRAPRRRRRRGCARPPRTRRPGCRADRGSRAWRRGEHRGHERHREDGEAGAQLDPGGAGSSATRAITDCTKSTGGSGSARRKVLLHLPVLLGEGGAVGAVAEVREGVRVVLRRADQQGLQLGAGVHWASSVVICRRSFSRARNSRAMIVPGATPITCAISFVVRFCT